MCKLWFYVPGSHVSISAILRRVVCISEENMYGMFSAHTVHTYIRTYIHTYVHCLYVKSTSCECWKEPTGELIKIKVDWQMMFMRFNFALSYTRLILFSNCLGLQFVYNFALFILFYKNLDSL